MTFYKVEPEVAGGLGERCDIDRSTTPFTVRRLHYEMDGWLGSELVTSYPIFIATEHFVEVMTKAALTGFKIDVVELTVSDVGEEFIDTETLPRFRWFKPTGRAQVDDFGVNQTAELIVSERAVALVRPLLGREVYVTEINS